jgi:hypothetical protein
VSQQPARMESTRGSDVSQRTRLRGRWLLLARVVWLAATLLAVGGFAASIPAYFAELHTVCTGPHAGCVDSQLRPESLRGLRELGVSLDFYARYSTVLQVAFGVAYGGVGALIFWRRSEDRGALLTSFWLVAVGTTFAGVTSVLELNYPTLDIFYSVLGNLAFLLLFYLFPDGRFVPRWTRWAAIFFATYFIVAEIFPNHPYFSDNWCPLLCVPFFLGSAGSMVYAQVYRYRRVSGQVQRLQTRWAVFGFIAAILAFIGLRLEDIFQLLPRFGAVGMFSELIYETVGSLAFLLIPLSIVVAIFRHRLYDIDLIIRRVLVYGPLTAVFIIGAFLAAGGITYSFSKALLPTLEILSKRFNRLPLSLQAALVGAVLSFASGLGLQLLRNRQERQERQTTTKHEEAQRERERIQEEAQQEHERVQEELRSQDEAFRSYLDSMYKLLLDHRLREQPRDSDARRLAQILTTILFLDLQEDGKGRLLQMLCELDLISRTNPIIELRNAALRTTNLRAGNLKGAELRGADLRDADLSDADLSDTCLADAKLFGAYLSGADLRGTNLKDAKGVSNEQLQQQAVALEGATMPNGQKYEDWLKGREGTREDGGNSDSS